MEVHQQTARGTARVLGIPKTTVIKLLRSILRMFLSRYQGVQMLQLGNPQLRIDFTNEFLIKYDAHNNLPLRMLSTDEANFNLNGNINTKNCVHWADTNPLATALVPLSDTKVTVCYGI